MARTTVNLRNRRTTSGKKQQDKKTGLARALSKMGFCSRSQAAALIAEGKVRLNGAVARNPEAPVRMGMDRVEVQGTRVAAAEKIYLMMNKPRGIVTTAADEKGRDTVYSLLPAEMKWVAPVGRLDQASEGLLLLTNDSEWGARIANPETHVDKTYHVQIGRVADAALVDAIAREVKSDGDMLKVKRASVLRAGEKNSWLEIVLDEGKNRQIRRIFEAIGIEVLRLVRVGIGEVRLGELGKGKWRELTAKEVASLRGSLRG